MGFKGATTYDPRLTYTKDIIFEPTMNTWFDPAKRLMVSGEPLPEGYFQHANFEKSPKTKVARAACPGDSGSGVVSIENGVALIVGIYRGGAPPCDKSGAFFSRHEIDASIDRKHKQAYQQIWKVELSHAAKLRNHLSWMLDIMKKFDNHAGEPEDKWKDSKGKPLNEFGEGPIFNRQNAVQPFTEEPYSENPDRWFP